MVLGLLQLLLADVHTGLPKFFLGLLGNSHPTGADGAAEHGSHGPLKTRRLFGRAEPSFNIPFGNWVSVELPLGRLGIVVNHDGCWGGRRMASGIVTTLLSGQRECKQQRGCEQG